MKNSQELIKNLESQLRPCSCGCGKIEKLDYTIENGVVTYACAYTDWHIRKPGDYSRGNYARVLKATGCFAAVLC